MPRKKNEVPILKVRKNATLREIYARARDEFTAADLQKYTEMEQGIPFEQVLAELEEIHHREARKRKAKK